MNQSRLPPKAQYSNRDIQAAWSYHRGTNHSYQSIHSGSHRLEFDNQPTPFKIYPQVEGQSITRELTPSGVSTWQALTAPAVNREVIPTAEDLAALLFYSGGVTKVGTVGDGVKMYFRAAACTGALYHIEIYLICGPMEGVDAGVYHFGPHDFALRKIRDRDHRRILIHATGGHSALSEAPAALVFTSVFWRNSWKYQARAYRHSFWDSGTMLANLLAVGAARTLR